MCLFSLFSLEAYNRDSLMCPVRGHTDSFSGLCAKEIMLFWRETNLIFLSSVIAEVIFLVVVVVGNSYPLRQHGGTWAVLC